MTERKRGHFARAARLAGSLGRPEEEIRDLRIKALWQMSAVYRNGPGTKRLAQEYGIPKQELRQLLERHAEERVNEEDFRSLEPCYDQDTGEYLPFGRWLDRLFKNWNRIPSS